MKERPILFSGEMVRAILEGRKTQTRRPIPWEVKQSDEWKNCFGVLKRRESRSTWHIKKSEWTDFASAFCPYGRRGEQLWVRETWAKVFDCPALPCECEEPDGARLHQRIAYKATEPNGIADYCRSFDDDRPATWTPSIHMPRTAARITLELTDVRVERLQDISEKDAQAEGYRPLLERIDAVSGRISTERRQFLASWAKRYGQGDPWVWVLGFRRVEAKGATVSA